MAIRLLHKALEESDSLLDTTHYTIAPNPVQAVSPKGVFIKGKEDLWAVPSYECGITSVPIIVMGKETQIREDQWVACSNKYSIAVALPTMQYGSVLFTNLKDVAFSFQTNVLIGSGTYDYNDFIFSTNIGDISNKINAIGLHTDVPQITISAYEALRRFDIYARSLITKQGVKLISTNIRDWASVEDPDWNQLVIDFEVEAGSDTALALWDRLNDELQDFLDIMDSKLTSDLHDLISMTVQWK